MSRLPKLPERGHLKRFTIFSLLSVDVRMILKKCKAPKHWSDNEISLLLHYFFTNNPFHAVKKIPTGPNSGNIVPADTAKDTVKLARALQFAQMCSEAPHEMIDILAKLRQHIVTLSASPAGGLRLLLAHYAESDLPEQRIEEILWDGEKTTKEVAGELTMTLGLSISVRVVEHARAFVRKQISP